ncbi:UviB-like protein [Niameybacter massiliensis]|uniref:UviB-like protein n=1 Tax=Holtiella tumoricola TaxID=3018743 RepID=A0AA42DM18_9FIRM|nr:UviB-like protein [Holtiella tumoricola]MDA3731439.1 UviB-like protein [Holtiella tumoricola]
MDIIALLTTIFSEQGFVYALFTGMLVWVFKKNDEREKRYINTIDNLTVNVSNKINVIEDDISEIKQLIK